MSTNTTDRRLLAKEIEDQKALERKRKRERKREEFREKVKTEFEEFSVVQMSGQALEIYGNYFINKLRSKLIPTSNVVRNADA